MIDIQIRPTGIDSQRALTIAAFDALIDVSMAKSTELMPFYSARILLQQLDSSGLADVTSSGDSLTMVMFGVRATANGGTALALLRNWQSAARDSMAQGVRI